MTASPPPPPPHPPPSLTLTVVDLRESVDPPGAAGGSPPADVVPRALDRLSCASPSEAAAAAAARARSRARGGVARRRRSPRSPPPPASSSEAAACPALRGKVETSILRYRRDEDRWTALASTLLKSAAFYRSLDLDPPPGETDGNGGDDGGSDDRGRGGPQAPMTDPGKLSLSEALDAAGEGTSALPIADLPRTDKHRPYLPLATDDERAVGRAEDGAAPPENRRRAMNVSHQHPWVCMAQQRPRPAEEEEEEEEDPPLLGLDVVRFEAKLGSFAPSTSDWLEHFEGSLTPWEWDRVRTRRGGGGGGRGRTGGGGWTDALFSSSRERRRKRSRRTDASQLREFFLRWSMKEAYTKALGVGMHLNFDAFETRLRGIDCDRVEPGDGGSDGDREEEEGIWSAIARSGARGGVVEDEDEKRRGGTRGRRLSVVGRVSRRDDPSPPELWRFVFVPLDGGGGDGDPPEEDRPCGACACICRGPLGRDAPGDDEEEEVSIEFEPLTLADLVRVHAEGRPWTRGSGDRLGDGE